MGCKDNAPAKMPDSNIEKKVKTWSQEDTRSVTGYFAKRGLTINTEKATKGYILFEPSASTSTYLMNKAGEVVHEWKGDLNSMQAYLRDNGNLIRLERDPDFPVFAAGGQAGRIREYTWEGEMIWDFKYASDKYLTHHDFELMPNGNVLAISYEVKTPEEAEAAGRDPEHIPGAGLWPDKIIEVKPTYPSGGEIIWQWHMWDHLIQDKFPNKANYGNIKDNPRKIDINAVLAHSKPPPAEQIKQMIKDGNTTSNKTVDNWHSDISHTNAIVYNSELDQIAISVPEYGEIFIIDHSTTAEEAKGSAGGRWGHGGDLLYRWGNPQTYGRGGPKDKVLFYQHDIRWIPKGYPGEGNLMVFNNDIPRGKNNFPSVFAVLGKAQHPDPPVTVADLGNYSAVHEITAPTDEKGNYLISENEPFGPMQPNWTYTAPDSLSFYSAFVSGAERLENGHTMILEGSTGRFVEIDTNKEIVWEYWNPYYDDYHLPDGTTAQPVGPFKFAQYRIKQYSPDYPGLNGKALNPIDPQPTPYIPEPLPPKKES